MTRLRARILDDVGRAVGRGHARSQILAAALDVFAKHGVAATRVEDILEAAGLSRRTFYLYFDDKHEVVRAIYELVTQHLAATFAQAAAGASDPMSAVTRTLEAYFEIHRTDRSIVRALIEESLRVDSQLFAMRARFRGQITDALVAALAAATRREIDRLVVIALVSALEGVSLELLAHPITEAHVARATATVTALLALVVEHPERVPSRPR